MDILYDTSLEYANEVNQFKKKKNTWEALARLETGEGSYGVKK